MKQAQNTKIQKFEFEARIFISFSIVIIICLLSFSIFRYEPANSVLIGKMIGLPVGESLSMGYLIAAFIMAGASILRIWSGSILTSKRMMAFRVQVDSLRIVGPYLFVRNPIYLSDLLAFSGFALCLPTIGILLPLLLFLHYYQLIRYEELSLIKQFGKKYLEYKRNVPRLIPNKQLLRNFREAFKTFEINRDGLRHNALYLLFIPGFVVSSFTHNIVWALVIGIPAVLDWAFIHTKIGIRKDSFDDQSERSENTYKKVNKKIFNDILYAQCWEDPQLDRSAFKITPDDVIFSITSGGCNVLTFLLDNPRKIIALDLNPYQNFLLDLKIAAFKMLSHDEMLEFLGIRESQRRLLLYIQLCPELQADSRIYWDTQLRKIRRGVIHCGRYERYMRLVRKAVIVPFIKGSLVKRFFEIEDSSEREKLFHTKWENIWWFLLTRVILSRKITTFLFDKAFFTYINSNLSFGKHFAGKALLGRFYSEEYLPHYLKKENYSIIRRRLDRIEMVTDSCDHFFTTLPDSCISKFNFTNIFEWMSPKAYENLLKETIRVAKDKAIMTYRNLLVFREHPSYLDTNIHSLKHCAKSLRKEDMSFIYNNYVVEEICKGATI
jgi:S-adenosylmethionine-diacylglycerol 3-amino-3-carboxypropyl transferase